MNLEQEFSKSLADGQGQLGNLGSGRQKQNRIPDTGLFRSIWVQYVHVPSLSLAPETQPGLTCFKKMGRYKNRLPETFQYASLKWHGESGQLLSLFTRVLQLGAVEMRTSINWHR